MNKRKLIVILISAILCFGIFYLFIEKSDFFITISDNNYRKEILKAAQNDTYTLKNLKPIVGKNELAAFIKKNDKNPDIYTPSEENIKNKKYRANLHIHTVNSDGAMTVEEVLNQAQDYAKTLPKNQYMYIAITDHNTVLGSQDIIRVLQKNPGKYSKIKIIPGIEIFTKYKNNIGNEDEIDIHVLSWCINPFDKFLMKAFEKKDLSDQYNWRERDFDELISMMKQYGITGVAHPARYTLDLNENKYPYFNGMIARYKQAGTSAKTLFVEGYYQNYDDLGEDHNKYLDFINEQSEKNSIMRTGSTDAHGTSLFEKKYYKKD